MRLTQIVVRSFDQDIGAVIARLERHARIADQTAIATELLRAAEFRKEAEQRTHKELKIQCERWLNPSKVKDIHLHHVRARLGGTCDWIISNDEYKRWVKPECSTTQDRLLVISGTHGCGKSVLASSIVVRLENDQQHTLFFAFSSSDGSRQTSENLIRTLLWQLVHKAANKESVDSVHNLRLDGQPTVSELWDAFRCMCTSLAKPVYCVIDGVDECSDFNHTMSTKIMHILGMCPNLRILLLGRPHVIQVHSQSLDFREIDINPTLLNQDIEAFIGDEIAKSDILSLPELREDISQTLKDKSDGMFLWVILMVDDLRRSSSKSELKERLQNLPRGLEEAYQLIFLRLSQNLDKFELRLARNVLAFMTVSCRPLRFDELRYALALHCRSLETVAQPVEEYLLLQPTQRILDITGGLVSITDGFLRLVHSSVREFLVRSEDRWIREHDRPVMDFRIDVAQTHRSFGWLCLDYMRLKKREKEDMQPNTSPCVRTLRDSHPLLEYATLYTFYHLNRSGPLCPTTLAKVKNVLESGESVFWVEHFAYFLLEDLTLELQMSEFIAFQHLMADASPNMSFFAIFEKNLKEMTSQMRNSGKNDDPRTETWEMVLDLAKNGDIGFSSQTQSNEASESVLEPSSAGLDLQAGFSESRPHSKDPSTAVTRIMNLLKGQTSLPIAHQIEMLLRLQSFLSKTRALIDPLKVLFQLILKKASSIPVYALVAIGEFYEKLEKCQEALEVYNVASKKIDRLDIPLKFTILSHMGYRHLELGSDMEALRCYEKAFFGREILLGKRHCDTLRCLNWMIFINHELSQHSEVLKLCDKMCIGQDSVPELGFDKNLRIQSFRLVAYRFVGDHDKAVHMKHCIQATLKLYHESHSKDHGKAPRDLLEIGYAHDDLGDCQTALEFFQLAFDAYSEANGPDYQMTLHSQFWMASMYRDLGRYQEAKELLELTYARQQRVLRPNHRNTQLTKQALDEFPSEDDYSSDDYSTDDYGCERSSLSSWQPSPINFQRRSFDAIHESPSRDIPQRRRSALF